ncbi:MAG: hypothetical protein WD894_16800 [Pirellulales bacterium]
MKKIPLILALLVAGPAEAGRLPDPLVGGTVLPWVADAITGHLNNDDYDGTFSDNSNFLSVNRLRDHTQTLANTERLIATRPSGGVTEYAVQINADSHSRQDSRATLDRQFMVQLGFGTGNNFVRAGTIAPGLVFDDPRSVSPAVEDYYSPLAAVLPSPFEKTPRLKLIDHQGDTLIFQGSSTSAHFARSEFYGSAVFKLPLDIPDLPASARALYPPTNLQGLEPEDIPFTLRVLPVPGQWGTWNVNADANWSHAGNWIGSVPNGPGTDATFSEVITAPRTVTIDVPVTVGRITFNIVNIFEEDQTKPKPYTIAGPGGITLDGPSRLPAEIKIATGTGSHTISAPLTLLDDTIINVIPRTSNLVISGEVNSTGKIVTKTGFGTFTTNNIRAAQLNLNGGTLAIAPNGTSAGTSVLGVLTISPLSHTLSSGEVLTPKLDLSNNAVIIDYTEASPSATVRQQIISGRGGSGHGKTWNGNGITSSAAAAANRRDPDSSSIGYAENSALPLGPYTMFRGQPADSTSLLIAYTRTGDANLDGIVNDDDVTIVNATYAPGVTQPNWALGDFDYNGFVDDDDVTLLGVFYDPSAPPLVALAQAANHVAAVPEPRTSLMIVIALAALVPLGIARLRKTGSRVAC